MQAAGWPCDEDRNERACIAPVRRYGSVDPRKRRVHSSRLGVMGVVNKTEKEKTKQKRIKIEYAKYRPFIVDSYATRKDDFYWLDVPISRRLQTAHYIV